MGTLILALHTLCTNLIAIALFLLFLSALPGHAIAPTDNAEIHGKKTIHGIAIVEFGERSEDKEIIHTREIRWMPGNRYDWNIAILASKPSVKVKQILTLPASARWIESRAPSDPSGRPASNEKLISEDGYELIEETTLDTTLPVLLRKTFSILPDDPKGTYRLRIYLEDELAVDFNFEIAPFPDQPSDLPNWAVGSWHSDTIQTIHALRQNGHLEDFEKRGAAIMKLIPNEEVLYEFSKDGILSLSNKNTRRVRHRMVILETGKDFSYSECRPAPIELPRKETTSL